MDGIERRLVSMPHKVRFCGFEATTHRLQQEGWEIAVHQDWGRDGIALLLQHRGTQCRAFTNYVRLWRAAESHLHPYTRILDREGNDSAMLRFEVVRIAYDFDVVSIDGTEYEKLWKQVDAEPQYDSRRIDRVSEMNIFATPLTRSEELIVDPDQVGAILEKLRQAQLPEQDAIRKRNRLRESREGLVVGAEPSMNFHAQILSIAA